MSLFRIWSHETSAWTLVDTQTDSGNIDAVDATDSASSRLKIREDVKKADFLSLPFYISSAENNPLNFALVL